MRKRKKGRKFGRKRDERKALMKALASALIKSGKIKTTEAKAKELTSFAGKLITKAKKGDINSVRQLSKLLSQTSVKKLVQEIAPKYKERKGGYTRIIKLGVRSSDGARLAIIEFIK